MTSLPWRTAWAIARRDLHRRFRGLRLLIICLVLGVGALAAIGTLTGAIRDELAAEGRAILGGDFQVEVWQRPLTAKERGFLSQYGTLSEGTRMQAMALTADAAAPVELKAVNAGWPLYGRFTLADGRSTGAPPPGQAWLADGAAVRLGVAPGDKIRIGTATLTVGGIIREEPDKLSEGFQLGQTAIVRDDMPGRAGLTAPGALYQTKVRVRFAGDTDPAKLKNLVESRFPDSGFEIRTRDTASPGAERFVSRMGQFLTLVGLAALSIAGIGIGGGVASYLEARRTGIATLKILGATSGDIARIYALQIGAAALAGAVFGLATGVVVTPLFSKLLGSLLPVRSGLIVDPWALARAMLFGLLVTLVFSAPPLARARLFPAMALIRARVAPLRRGRTAAALPIAIGLGGIASLAFIGASDPLLTATFLGGAAALLALLALLGLAIRWVAAHLPRSANPLLRAGLANLHRPGAATAALVSALGFGLSTFVLLAAVETSLDANITRSVPARAPDYFVLDIPKDGIAPFRRVVDRDAPGSVVRTVPTLRGAILAYGPKGHMTRVNDLKDLPAGAWALRGERGLTYAARAPEGNTLTAGAWWPENYAGEPLVSVDEDFAKAT
ncbi:MAG: ABC transporter permease, partial [Croceibacterium sp.]